jgi:hypothetical protein
MIDENALEQRISSSAAEQWRKQQHIPRVPTSDRNDTRSPAGLGRSHAEAPLIEAEKLFRQLAPALSQIKIFSSLFYIISFLT